jgi:hypothetical protein
MSELRRLLGPVQFNRLCDLAGGTRVHVPKHYGKPPSGGRDTSVRLKRLFGEPLAILLVFHFGDSVVHVPKRRGNIPFDRAKLKRLARTNLSANRIARKVGCDRRTVEKTRSRLNGQRSLSDD